MAASTQQRKSRADAKLDHRLVADLPFFAESNRVKKHKAAIYLAEDELSDRELCRRINISTATLHEWKQNSEFQSIVGHYTAEIISESLKLPIAKKHERIKALNDLFMRQQEAIAARAARNAAELDNADDPDVATRRFFGNYVPEEARTGLFVREVSMSASGKEVVNYKYDTAITKDIKDTLKQAAQELGQFDQTLNLNHGGEVSVDLMQTAQELAVRYGTTPEEVLALASEDEDE